MDLYVTISSDLRFATSDMSPSSRQSLVLANYRQLRKAGYAIVEVGPIYL
jgi:hypothetical protein